MVLGFVAFQLPVFCFSVLFGGSCFSVVSIWVRILFIFFTIYLFTYFYYLKVRKPTLVSKLLACIKSSWFGPNFYHSCSIPFLYRIVLKIIMKYIFVVFSCPFLSLVSLHWIVTWVVICEAEIRTANLHKMPIKCSTLAIKRAPADCDSQICNLGPTFIWICHFPWVVWSGYTRPRDWLSVLLLQIWPSVL